MVHKFLISGIAVLLTCNLFSQGIMNPNITQLDQLQYEVYKNNRLLSDEQVGAAEGSPYIHKDWNYGKITLNGSDKVYEAKMRYNNYSDEIEINDNNVIKTFGNKIAIKEIVIGIEVYKVYPYEENKQIKQGFYLELSSGKVGLYSKTPVIYKPAKQPTSGYDQPEPAKFIVKPTEYYVRNGNSLPVLVPGNKKKAIEALTNAEINLSDYLSENKLRTTEEGLRDLVRFLNN